MNQHLDSGAIADYLADNPHFFEEHSDLLAKVKLTSPLLGRAVSLQERQMEVVREKVRGLELRLVELVRLAEENDAIVQKLLQWTQELLLARNDVDLPHTLVSGLQSIFSVPYATLRLWGVAEQYAHTWFAAPASDDVRLFCNSLAAPYCGPNQDFEAASWFEDGAAVRSIAMLPLRADSAPETFGLLVIGSADPDRFSADMATDFLEKIGVTASAALRCLLD